MELTAFNVSLIFKKCAYIKDSPRRRKKLLNVEGYTTVFSLRSNKIEKFQADIISMLRQLPVEFQEKTGAGWTVLSAGVRSDGLQWGGSSVVEQLVVLGIASGWVKYMTPKETWVIFAGEMPYFTIFEKRKEG